ncbi:Zn-ribbon domain-containing OB-fold protein [Mycobacterium sp. HNNTM2301]|uniref:Zn-ribbon domain-containing OB-fold protein n=1 Tax=Mycobacterium hainanense TaxID=3289775 RepID=UPI0035A7455D
MATRPAPAITGDSEFFWNGLRDNKLLIQRCGGCGQLRHPPRPMCPHCRSLDWDTVESSGRGTVYSYVLPHEPKFPFFEYPYVVVLVELEEGVRLVSNLTDVNPAEVRTGMPVEAHYQGFDGPGFQDLVLHQFRPATEAS